MTAIGELIYLPVPSPAPVATAVQAARPAIRDALSAPWRQRIYRAPSRTPDGDFVYGADGLKRGAPGQGKHIDLYA